MEPEIIERNRRQQAELYGAALGDLVLTVRNSLGLTQRRIAEVLGLSPPMLSQLISAQRVKIGNPAVVARLTALLDLAETNLALEPDELEARLGAVSLASGAFTQQSSRHAVTEEVRKALLATGSPARLRASAELVEPSHAALARLLREAADHG
ncbi:helix-turn-helix domain-containing protein [Phytoactinopolyspora limicola]|uniref:helix-turn-helix domain-containing protein n=1 Tax=Phytoactinopolyspora limicola TaxID=2715536 RepID=UPI00140D6026|nr:helix-turn-helix domain-containing protein [Phytoactinopolyspora limicola]